MAELHSLPREPHLGRLNLPDILPSLERIVERAVRLRPIARFELRRPAINSFVQLFGELFDLIETGMPEQPNDSLVADACMAIRNEPASRRPLLEIADELGVGYAALRKRFKRVMGMSLAQFRVHIRIQEAERLLVHHSVKQVAEDLNYADPFMLSAQFKKVTGISPRQYKANH